MLPCLAESISSFLELTTLMIILSLLKINYSNYSSLLMLHLWHRIITSNDTTASGGEAAVQALRQALTPGKPVSPTTLLMITGLLISSRICMGLQWNTTTAHQRDSKSSSWYSCIDSPFRDNNIHHQLSGWADSWGNQAFLFQRLVMCFEKEGWGNQTHCCW